MSQNELDKGVQNRTGSSGTGVIDLEVLRRGTFINIAQMSVSSGFTA